MFLKINEMRKCHPHQGFWRRGEVGDFASRDASEANPRGLTHAVAIRYEDSGPSEPKPVIFRGILSVTAEIGLFFSKFKCGVVRPVKDSVLWNPFDAPSHPSIKQIGEKLQAEGPQLEWDACASQSSGRNASATTEAQQVAFWK